MLMNIEKINAELDSSNWICPDIRSTWKLAKVRGSQEVLLKAIEGERQFRFTEAEGYALRHFTGFWTVREVQSRLHEEFNRCDRDLVEKLVEKLIDLGIIARMERHRLKTIAQWLEHPDGSWILRNPVEMTFLQVSPEDKVFIEKLGVSQDVTAEFTASGEKFYSLLELLAATGMLEPDVC